MYIAGQQGLRHFVEKLVENEQCIIGQFALGQARRRTQIRKQNCDQALAAFEAAADRAVSRTGVCRQERQYGDVSSRADLAGKLWNFLTLFGSFVT